MKVIVTGGAGFIGSNLAFELENQGFDVMVLDNYRTGHLKNLEGFGGKIHSIDRITDKNLSTTGRAEIIFHQAAITDTTINDQMLMMQNNVEEFKQVLDYALKHNAKVVFASSAAVYGRGPSPMYEDQELKPLNIYGHSKMAMEKVAKTYAEKHCLETIGLRYFNVFGPRESFKGKIASMIYQLTQQMLEGKRPRLFEFGEQKRDHVYVKDVVQANLQAMKCKEQGIFNVGTGTATSFNDLVKWINETLDLNLQPKYFKNPYDFYQNETQADPSLALKTLGFKPKYSTKEGLKEYVTKLAKENAL